MSASGDPARAFITLISVWPPGERAGAVVGRKQLDRFCKRSRPRISDLTKKHSQYVL